tara:strand:+ start:539 stop:709 length:171 start_codon:yes stop_codon:yes gene_type:complete
MKLPLKKRAAETEVYSFRLAKHVKHNIDIIARDNNQKTADVVRHAVNNLVNSIINE